MNREQRRLQQKYDRATKNTKRERSENDDFTKSSRWARNFYIYPLMRVRKRDINLAVSMFTGVAVNKYMVRCFDIEYPITGIINSVVSNSNVQNLSKSIHESIARFQPLLSNDKVIHFRAYDNETVTNLYIAHGETVSNINIFAIKHDLKTEITEITIYTDYEGFKSIRGTGVEFYHSLDHNRAKSYVKARHSGQQPILIGREILAVVDQILRMAPDIKTIDEYDTNALDNEHSFSITDVERNFISDCMDAMGVVQFNKSIFSVSLDGSEKDYIQDIVGYTHITQFDDYEYPLVNFNDKEDQYIIDYIVKHQFFGSKGKKFDIAKYLSDQRYGTKLRFKYDIGDKKYTIYSDYEILEEKNSIVVKLICPLGNMRHVWAVYVLNNIHEHKSYDDLILMESIVSMGDVKQIFNNTGEVLDIIPHVFTDRKECYDLLARVIGTYIVIHDRPKRSVMVHERLSPAQPSANKPTKANDNTSDPDYVVRRILMTVKGSKEYIRTRESSNHNVQYVVESWHRMGHWRTYQKTGKKVYVKPTTCHRQGDLVQKEIRLKL